jgi:hypothetical protein
VVSDPAAGTDGQRLPRGGVCGSCYRPCRDAWGTPPDSRNTAPRRRPDPRFVVLVNPSVTATLPRHATQDLGSPLQQLREARPLRGLVIRRRRPHRHAKAGRSPLVPVQPPMGLPELRLPALHRGTVRPRRTLRWVDPLCAASRTAVEPDRAIAYAARDHPVLTWEKAEQPARDAAPGSEAGARAPRAFRLALGHSTSLVPRRAGVNPSVVDPPEPRQSSQS